MDASDRLDAECEVAKQKRLLPEDVARASLDLPNARPLYDLPCSTDGNIVTIRNQGHLLFSCQAHTDGLASFEEPAEMGLLPANRDDLGHALRGYPSPVLAPEARQRLINRAQLAAEKATQIKNRSRRR